MSEKIMTQNNTREQGQPSPRPWRVGHVTRGGTACVKGADNSIVAIMHVDNARLMVDCVNGAEGAGK